MSNLQFTVLAWAALAAHVGALAMALARRGDGVMLGLNLAVAAACTAKTAHDAAPANRTPRTASTTTTSVSSARTVRRFKYQSR